MRGFRLGGVLAAAVLATVSLAGDMLTPAEFKTSRKKNGIDRTSRLEDLETLAGTRILEIKGKLAGTFNTPEHCGLILSRGKDSDDLAVESDAVPDWLVASDATVRLIVRASRDAESGALQVRLISVIPADAVSDLAPPVKQLSGMGAPAKPASTTPRATSTPVSRGGTTRAWRLPASEAAPIYAAFAKKQNPKLTAQQARLIADSVIGFSLKNGIDARLVMAVILAESTFNPNDTSHTGAGGLGQLMPGTARELGVRNRYDVVENVWGMVRLLRQHLETYTKQGNDPYRALELALAAYNAGPGAVKRHGGVPPYRETQRYVQKVITFYRGLRGE